MKLEGVALVILVVLFLIFYFVMPWKKVAIGEEYQPGDYSIQKAAINCGKMPEKYHWRFNCG